MKKTLIVITLLCISWTSYAQSRAVSDFYLKYKEKDCLNFDLSTNLFKCIDSKGEGKDSFSTLLKGIDQVKLFRISRDQLTAIPKDITKLRKDIRGESFEDLVSMKDKDGEVYIMVRESRGSVKEFVMVSNGSDGLLVMNVTGDFPKNKVRALSNEIKISIED